MIAACSAANPVDAPHDGLVDAGHASPPPHTDANAPPVPSVPQDAGTPLPSATDGKKNGTETDVDCGGKSAPACAAGKACKVTTDCVSIVCLGGVCQAVSSSDGIKNGDESDVDCGGTSAPKCDDQKACKVPADCQSALCVGGTCNAITSTDGIKNGTETDIDCGGMAAPKCGTNKACKVASDCESKVCTNGACIAASPTDGVQNGDESDVDCGGSGGAVRCVAKQKCVAHGDCASGACPNKTCSESPSCKLLAGGATCGAGEVGDANAVHEDCCVSLTVPRDAAAGGPFKLDKYLITAGRMRAFLETVNYDVQGWVAAHRPAWWTGSGTSSWDAMLPTSKDDFILRSIQGNVPTTGSSGCLVGLNAASHGAMAYWASAADLSRVVGGGPRTFSQDELDTKVMNCFQAPLFHALCAFDGGRVASRAEWIAARTVNGVVLAYPWGANGSPADREARAVYNFNYSWPRRPGNADADWGGFLPAPGRFPLGAGPYGHADLLGSVENMGSRVVNANGPAVTGDGWFQFSFQEAEQASHPYGQQLTAFGAGSYRPHWAVGARCVKP